MLYHPLSKQGAQKQNSVSPKKTNKRSTIKRIRAVENRLIVIELPNGEEFRMQFYSAKAGQNEHDFILARFECVEGKQKTHLNIDTEHCWFFSGKKVVEGLDGVIGLPDNLSGVADNATVHASELAKAKVVNHAGKPQVIA